MQNTQNNKLRLKNASPDNQGNPIYSITGLPDHPGNVTIRSKEQFLKKGQYEIYCRGDQGHTTTFLPLTTSSYETLEDATYYAAWALAEISAKKFGKTFVNETNRQDPSLEDLTRF